HRGKDGGTKKRQSRRTALAITSLAWHHRRVCWCLLLSVLSVSSVVKYSLNFAMRRGRLEGPVGKRDQFVIAEEVRRLFLHDPQDRGRELANLRLCVPTPTQLDEVPQRPRVGRHEDFRLGRVGQHASSRLPRQLP